MDDTKDPGYHSREIHSLTETLTKCECEKAVLRAQNDILLRQIEDLRMQLYRLDAQYTESRIGRAVAEERAAAAREIAAMKCCGTGAPPITIIGGLPQPCGCGHSSAAPQQSTTPPVSVPEPAKTRKLFISRLVMNETPQSGTWLMCFTASAPSGSSDVFNIKDKTYEGDGVQIDMDIVLSPVNVGDEINFKCYLDDDQSSVCAESAEDKSSGSFRASESGSQSFSFDSWSYVLSWRME